MSSYASGEYYILVNNLRNIVQQCEQELQQAERAATQNKQEWEKMLQQRAKKQAELIAQAHKISGEVMAQELHADTQRKVRTQRVESLLHQAEKIVQHCETEEIKDFLRERLRVMQTSFSMFGATTEIKQQLEQFLQREVPEAQEKARQMAEQKFTEEALQGQHNLFSNVEDTSLEFVSLRTKEEQKQNAYISPWQSFVEKLQKLCLQEEELGEKRAQILLKEAERTVPDCRNLFLLNHQAEVEDLEKAYVDLEAARKMQAERTDKLQNRYLALCMLCRVRPALLEDVSDVELEKECKALFARFQKEKEQQYVTNAFAEVLESFGIDFESMQTDDLGQMQMRYHISAQAELQVIRSDAGAFEMQFSGISEGEQASLDEKRQVVEQAHSFCKRLPQIAEALRKRGIVFEQVGLQEPNEDTVAMVPRFTRSQMFETKKARELP